MKYLIKILKMISSLLIGIGATILALLGYAIYTLVYKNAMLRLHYQKYANVGTYPDASFVKGDIPYIRQHYISKGKPFVNAFADLFLRDPRKDFIFTTFGTSNLHACSPEAISEALAKIPSHIDRGVMFRMFSRVFPKSAFVNRSTGEWKQRRDNTGKSIQFNKASQYMKLIM